MFAETLDETSDTHPRVDECRLLFPCTGRYIHPLNIIRIIMQLIAPRLCLAEIQNADLEAIHELHSTPAVDQYNTLGLPESIAVTDNLLRTWLAGQTAVPRMSYLFCIRNTGSGTFIGMIGLRLGKLNYRIGEVWCKLMPLHWGKGYATEALDTLLRFGFNTLNLHRIEAGCAVANMASSRVLEKAGMILEGLKRKILPIRGEWVDNYNYAILEEDFKK